MGAGTPLPKDDNPQYQQWTFSVQREVPGQGVVEINYAGTKGTHLYYGTGDVVAALNNLNPIYWGLGRGTSGTGLNAQVPNPFYGIITNPVATSYKRIEVPAAATVLPSGEKATLPRSGLTPVSFGNALRSLPVSTSKSRRRTPA